VVKSVTAQLIENGSVTRGFLGVGIQDVTSDIANGVGLATAQGALVTEPTEGGPAGKAGVKSGDVITAVDGRQVKDALDLSRTIASKAPGAEVTLDVWRDGKSQQIRVTLGTLDETTADQNPDQTAPQQDESGPTDTSVGLTLVPNSDGPGLLIQDVDPNSTAAEKGFAVGDTILQVDNKDVTSVKDFEDAIKAVKESGRGTALIKEQRDGNTRFIGLPLEDSANG
jgi:serine protease Do